MSCNFDCIDALLDGSMPEEECASLLAHINSCPTCGAYYQVMSQLEGEENVPAGFSQRVMEQVRITPQAKARRFPYHKLISAVAACAVLVVSLQLLPLSGKSAANDSAESISMKIVPESQGEGDLLADAAADDSLLQVYALSDEEQCAMVRQWLHDNKFSPLYGEDAPREAYDLTAEDVLALNQAFPQMALPEQMLQLELKSAK